MPELKVNGSRYWHQRLDAHHLDVFDLGFHRVKVRDQGSYDAKGHQYRDNYRTLQRHQGKQKPRGAGPDSGVRVPHHACRSMDGNTMSTLNAAPTGSQPNVAVFRFKTTSSSIMISKNTGSTIQRSGPYEQKPN